MEVGPSHVNSYTRSIVSPLILDTINTFWTSVKYEYEGENQKIIPLTIKQFITLIETLIKIKKKRSILGHKKLC